MDSNYSLIGIGSGPFNLSLNALMNKTGLKAIFFDRRNDSRWHPNFLLANCDLQVSWVRDLVSTIDPTSRYSFLNFLVETKQIFNFLSVRFDHVPRKTFSEYYNWVSEKLNNIQYNENIELVDFD